MNTIEEDFNQLKDMAMNPKAGALQITECRRFFIGGAYAMFHKMMAIGELPEAEAFEETSKITREISTLTDRIGKDL